MILVPDNVYFRRSSQFIAISWAGQLLEIRIKGPALNNCSPPTRNYQLLWGREHLAQLAPSQKWRWGYMIPWNVTGNHTFYRSWATLYMTALVGMKTICDEEIPPEFSNGCLKQHPLAQCYIFIVNAAFLFVFLLMEQQYTLFRTMSAVRSFSFASSTLLQ